MAVVLPVILFLVLVIINVYLFRASPAVYQLYDIYMNPESRRYRSRNDRNPYIPVSTSEEVADEAADAEEDSEDDKTENGDEDKREEENHDGDNNESADDKRGNSRFKHTVLKLPRIGYPPPSALSKEALMPGRSRNSLLKKAEIENRLDIAVNQ
jgi:hypothetical protein